MSSKYVTLKQALALKELGFNEWVTKCAYQRMIYPSNKRQYYFSDGITPTKATKSGLVIGIPTVDHAIDWIRRNHNIVIYNSTEPFVHPITKNIVYSYGVKFCNIRDGWNGREYIHRGTDWNKDPYVGKRHAINHALNYIKNKKNAENRRKSKNR